MKPRFVRIVSIPSTMAWYNRPDVFGHTFEVLDQSPFDYVKIEYEPGVTGWLSLEHCLINPHLQLVPQKENSAMSTTDLQEIPTTLQERIFMQTIIRVLDKSKTKEQFLTACHADVGSLCFTKKDGTYFPIDFEEYSGAVIEKDGELFVSFWSKSPDWDIMLEPEHAVPTTWDQLSTEYELTEANHNVFLVEDESSFIGFEIIETKLFTYSDESRDYVMLYEANKEDLARLNKNFAETGKDE